MKRDATLVIVGAPKTTRLLGPLGHVIRVKLAAWRGSQKAVFFVAKFQPAGHGCSARAARVREGEAGRGERYELAEVADALRYLGEGHARGKIVISV